MGYNTVVVLYDDQRNRWPEDIKSAASSLKSPFSSERSFASRESFGYGSVISTDHADEDQVCVVGQNFGRRITSLDAPDVQSDLNVLADLLRAHGYSVKAPGVHKLKGPTSWGYHARQKKAGE